jgi:hypothetical protein
MLKRWLKKKRNARGSLVAEVCGMLPLKSFVTDVLLSRYEKYDKSDIRAGALFWPLTREALLDDPNALIALIHMRASLTAEDFASFDREQVMLGLCHECFPLIFASGSVIMHGEMFGHYQEFRTDDVHQGDAYPTYLALLVLERQARLYEMLDNVVQRLCEGLMPGSLSVKWNDLVKGGFEGNDGGVSSFRPVDGMFVSPVADLQLASSLVQSQSESHYDELLMVHSDLESFVRLRAEYKTFLETKDDSHSAGSVIALTFGVFQNVVCWHFLYKAVDDLIRVRGQNADALEVGRPRPEEYETCLAWLNTLVLHMLCKSMNDLNAFHRSSPLFKNRVRRGVENGNISAFTMLGYRSEMEFLQKDRLLCLIDLLCREHRFIPQALPHLHKLLGRRDQAERMSPKILKLISEVGTLWRLLEFCRYHKPAVAEREVKAWEKRPSIAVRYINALRRAPEPETLGRYGTVERGLDCVRQPRPDGAKDKIWLERMDKENTRLAVVWPKLAVSSWRCCITVRMAMISS